LNSEISNLRSQIIVFRHCARFVTAVILSLGFIEAKNLRFEMLRFAQHDDE